jgi:hypothetical protein
MTLTARAKPSLWIFVVLAPTFLGLVWAGIHAWTSGVAGTKYHGRGAGLLIFFGCAAACAFALAVGIRSRIAKRGRLEISDEGITSRVLGGRGTLAWSAVTHLTSESMWLYVHGKEPSGRPRKLAVSLVHLDKSADEILAAIRAYRPDLEG